MNKRYLIRFDGTLISLNRFLYDLMAHKTNIQPSTTCKHDFGSINVVISEFFPICNLSIAILVVFGKNKTFICNHLMF